MRQDKLVHLLYQTVRKPVRLSLITCLFYFICRSSKSCQCADNWPEAGKNGRNEELSTLEPILDARTLALQKPAVITSAVDEDSHRDEIERQLPMTDLGLITDDGRVQIGDFSRSPYPWETAAGIKWLRSL